MAKKQIPKVVRSILKSIEVLTSGIDKRTLVGFVMGLVVTAIFLLFYLQAVIKLIEAVR